MSRGNWFLATLVALIGLAAAAEPREIVLWPEGVPEPRLPAEPAESVEKKADGIARRANVSNPRLVVYDIPRGGGPRRRDHRAGRRLSDSRRRTRWLRCLPLAQ